MSLEAARNLSVTDLPHVLDEKLGLEYAGLRESHLPPVVSLGPHVGISWFCHLILKECRGGFLQLNVNPAGRKSRSQSTRYSETHLLLPEPAAAGEQATARDDFSNCSTCPQQVRYRYTPHHRADPRMPVLARVHHLDTGELDADIQQGQGLAGVEPEAVQGSSSKTPSPNGRNQGGT